MVGKKLEITSKKQGDLDLAAVKVEFGKIFDETNSELHQLREYCYRESKEQVSYKFSILNQAH